MSQIDKESLDTFGEESSHRAQVYESELKKILGNESNVWEKIRESLHCHAIEM